MTRLRRVHAPCAAGTFPTPAAFTGQSTASAIDIWFRRQPGAASNPVNVNKVARDSKDAFSRHPRPALRRGQPASPEFAHRYPRIANGNFGLELKTFPVKK